MKKLAITAAVVGCLGLSSQVYAATILTIGDAYYLGVITPGVGSPTTEAGNITTLVGLAPGDSTSDATNTYTRSSNTLCYNTCPDATETGSVGDDTGGNTGSFGDGFTYLLAKYDADKAGAYVWYVAGLTGDFTLPTNAGTCGSTGCGLSHWLLYNPTEGPGDGPGEGPGDGPGEGPAPEPASLLLFGSALSAFGFRMRRALR